MCVFKLNEQEQQVYGHFLHSFIYVKSNRLVMSAKIVRKLPSFGLLLPLILLLCQLDGMFVHSEKFHDCSNHHKTPIQGHQQRHSTHKHAHYDEIPFLTYDDNDTTGIDIKLMQHIYGRHKRKYYELNHSHELPPWPVKKEAVVEGDLILGGLMMVSKSENLYGVIFYIRLKY